VLAARCGPLQTRCLPSSLLRRSFVAPESLVSPGSAAARRELRPAPPPAG